MVTVTHGKHKCQSCGVSAGDGQRRLERFLLITEGSEAYFVSVTEESG
jgi:hypothetical protein